jgi:hypothetical protein
MNFELEKDFPNLFNNNYKIINVSNPEEYNCHAFSLNILDMWCGSSERSWPSNIPRNPILENYIKYFNLYGYILCDSLDYEENYDRIAIYVNSGYVTHSCRQFGNMWRSKLGPCDILEHKLDWISGDIYGNVECVMKRKI